MVGLRVLLLVLVQLQKQHSAPAMISLVVTNLVRLPAICQGFSPSQDFPGRRSEPCAHVEPALVIEDVC